MKKYPISKEAEMKLHEMMVNEEMRMAIQSENADRSFLAPLVGKIWMTSGRDGKDEYR
jgi:hypothetical protein